MCIREPRCRIEIVGDVAVVTFDRRHVLGEQDVRALGEQLDRLGEGAFRREVRVDLAGVAVLDSAAVSALLALHKKLAAAGGRLVVSGADDLPGMGGVDAVCPPTRPPGGQAAARRPEPD